MVPKYLKYWTPLNTCMPMIRSCSKLHIYTAWKLSSGFACMPQFLQHYSLSLHPLFWKRRETQFWKRCCPSLPANDSEKMWCKLCVFSCGVTKCGALWTSAFFALPALSALVFLCTQRERLMIVLDGVTSFSYWPFLVSLLSYQIFKVCP
jgi:hypothetical protein